MNNKIKCSVGILTFNSEKTLEKALNSVKDFAEIIICDGGSTDNTLDIANKYNCKIIRQDNKYKNPDGTINDFSGVRNQCLNSSIYNWFLYIDSDEYLSKEVVPEIRKIIQKDNQFVFNMPRKYVLGNEIIDCATTYPNYQIRLFKKNKVKKFIKKVHERIDIKDDIYKYKLNNCEYVPLDSFNILKEKWSKYLEIEKKRNINLGFSHWLRYTLYQNLKVSLLYFLRLIKIFLFCRGNKMPFKYEMLRHWYNFKLISITSKNIFKFK